MTQLQLALDMMIDLDRAIELITPIIKYVDIIEAGTPLVLKNGMEAVHRLSKSFPEKEILCDGKVMDAGAYEVGEMFKCGANWVTVMACTDNTTIEDCVKAAHDVGGYVMADMLCVENIPSRVALLEKIGVDCIAVHTGVDQQRQGQTPLDDLQRLKKCVTHTKIAVAGGITVATVDEYLKLKPDIVIVGGGILSQKDPVRAAAAIHNRICSALQE